VRAALPAPDPAVRATATICDEPAGQVIHTTIRSAVYAGSVPISVYLPPCYARGSHPLPVIYLLHGGNADETQWPDLRVQPAADDLIASGARPFVVVMPGGEYRSDVDYAMFVLSDLIPAVDCHFRVRTASAGRAIGGISLGGYWALKLAFSHPQLFAAAGGHSPVVDRRQSDDPLALAHTADGLRHLVVTLDVGDADALGTNTERLADVLRERSVSVAFSRMSGKHDRVYWRAHTSDYLRFYDSALK